MTRDIPEQAAFYQALAQCDLQAIRDCVSQFPEFLDGFDDRNFGATPLTAACFRNRPEVVELLIELGADPDKRSDWHMGPWSPLHCAIFRGDKELANLLLTKGATLDIHTAAGLGDCDAVKELLDVEPTRVHERGGDGCLPLHFADTPAVANLLLERGADIDGRCIDHYSTPVQYLCSLRPEVARFLLSRGATPDIFSSAMCGDIASIEALLSERPDLIDARINQTFFPPGPEHDVHNTLTFAVGYDATPLHAAAKGNLPEVISLLVRCGLSPNVPGGYDEATPLHLAAWSNCSDSAQSLLENGANIEARSGKLHNNTPAGWAIVAGSDKVFDLLSDHEAQHHPWFLEDARSGCQGCFDAINYVPAEQRARILSRILLRLDGN